jgi:23S rRNA pseudouridine1911/1915/1917 synthase
MGEASGDIGVIFEDGQLIGLVKPAGLPTANAPRGSASIYTWLQRRLGAAAFVGIVSRLDAPVSGVVVVAKTPAAAAHLARQFRERTVAKEYAAVVEGRFPAPLGQWVDWHDAVARRADEPRSTLERDVAAGDVAGEEDDETVAGGQAARAAHVRARVVRRGGEVSLVELEPSTGRRHQLRVQLAGRGCPIVGDRLYGARLPHVAGIALHARRLTIEHPETGATVVLEAGPPPAWKERFPWLFRDGAGR